MHFNKIKPKDLKKIGRLWRKSYFVFINAFKSLKNITYKISRHSVQLYFSFVYNLQKGIKALPAKCLKGILFLNAPFLWIKSNITNSIVSYVEGVNIFRILEKIGFLTAMVIFLFEIGDRRENSIYNAWQIVDSSSKDEKTGILVIAIERLAKEDFNLAGIKVINSNLSGLRLKNIALDSSIFEGSDFYKAKLLGVSFYQAILEHTDFRSADLRFSDFSFAFLHESDLSNANLKNSKLIQADLKNADLEAANLKNSNMNKANLEGAILEGAFLHNANLKDAVLDIESLEDAFLCNTVMPDGAISNRDCKI